MAWELAFAVYLSRASGEDLEGSSETWGYLLPPDPRQLPAHTACALPVVSPAPLQISIPTMPRMEDLQPPAESIPSNFGCRQSGGKPSFSVPDFIRRLCRA
eukprot:GHVS01010923.1.p2 GENE.GHVS01010923.1~~GHVS01010923.1.p2  ORF type:complete len:101 (-),score=8.88 GHVS01010923.1:171-473(-)